MIDVLNDIQVYKHYQNKTCHILHDLFTCLRNNWKNQIQSDEEINGI